MCCFVFVVVNTTKRRKRPLWIRFLISYSNNGTNKQFTLRRAIFPIRALSAHQQWASYCNIFTWKRVRERKKRKCPVALLLLTKLQTIFDHWNLYINLEIPCCCGFAHFFMFLSKEKGTNRTVLIRIPFMVHLAQQRNCFQSQLIRNAQCREHTRHTQVKG